MENTQDKVRSLWVPLRNMNLLLPNLAVAEIGSYRTPDPLPNGPDWLLGTIKWRGINIPVLSLEALCGIKAPSNPVFSRLMIINSVRADSTVSHYAIVTAGLPGLIQFDNDTARSWEASDQEGLKCILQIGTERAAIPDLDYLQAMLEQQFNRAA